MFFEVKPDGTKGRERYLAEARALKERLVTMSGFINVERFTNETVALIEGSNAAGGTHWQVIRDYGMHDRLQAPRE